MMFQQLQYRFKYKFKFVVINMLVVLGFFYFGLGYAMPAEAMVKELQISGDRGYQVQTIFSYDETKSLKEITELDHDDTAVVDSLTVRFYDPSGSLVASYDNIVDGVVQGNYFEFHYDPKKQKLWGIIDLGGESVGEMYLKGNVAEELSLITVESTGEEKIIDRMLVDGG